MTSTDTQPLAEILALLGDELNDFDLDILSRLSDLSPDELREFQNAWQSYSILRQEELFLALVETAKEHITYDFRAIFIGALNAENPAIRALSIEGLWEDTRPHLIETFSQMLQHDPDPDVRAAAAVALGRFIYWGEVGDVESETIAVAFQRLWDCCYTAHEVIAVRCRALEAIGASSEPGVVRLIENALYAEDPRLRISALQAMGRSADPRWIPYLTPELNQPDVRAGLTAMQALGELEARSAVKHIIHHISHEQELSVLLAALDALGQIGGEDAKKALEAVADWEDEDLVDAAQQALEVLHSEDSSTIDIINEVLDIEEDEEELDLFDDYYEDPLQAEISRLLDEQDNAIR